MNCKYTLRDYLKKLETFNKELENNYYCYGMDYSKKIIIFNSLQKRINAIKEYLSIDYEKPRKKSINEIFHESIKHMKGVNKVK